MTSFMCLRSVLICGRLPWFFPARSKLLPNRRLRPGSFPKREYLLFAFTQDSEGSGRTELARRHGDFSARVFQLGNRLARAGRKWMYCWIMENDKIAGLIIYGVHVY